MDADQGKGLFLAKLTEYAENLKRTNLMVSCPKGINNVFSVSSVRDSGLVF